MMKDWDERMDEMHLSVFHYILNRAPGKCSRNSISSAVRFICIYFLSLARDCIRHLRYMI